MASASRRGFLKELIVGGARAAREVSSALRSAEDVVAPFDAGERVVRAGRVQRAASAEELAALCRAVGLDAGRAEAAQRLARTGLRLVPDRRGRVGSGASRLGGVPAVPEDFRWPRRGDVELAFLCQIDLREAAGLVPTARLPAVGTLLFFYDAEGQPSGLAPADGQGCRAFAFGDGESLQPLEAGNAAFGEHPLVLSRELMLPPAHSFHLDPLDLEPDEFAAWSRLRERLAELQGVVLDEESPGFVAVHRLLGHAEPVYGSEMELDCQLASNGLDLSEGEGYFHARRDELEPGAADWQLLLQLSFDPELGLDWGDTFRRLYVWIRREDLVSGEFSRVWPMLQ